MVDWRPILILCEEAIPAITGKNAAYCFSSVEIKATLWIVVCWQSQETVVVVLVARVLEYDSVIRIGGNRARVWRILDH